MQPSFLSWGQTPHRTDTINTLLKRIAGGVDNGSGGGGGTILDSVVWAASGVPAHTPTIDRQIYLNTDDGTQFNWYSSAWH